MKLMAIAAMAATIALSAANAQAAGAAPRPGIKPDSGSAQPAQAPAGMPSFYQPSYSIDRKEWWQPHPYFQSNGQGFGYPSRPVHPHHGQRR